MRLDLGKGRVLNGETDWTELQDRLLVLFESYGLHVAVGLMPGAGIVIRSQDERVDASNLGTVRTQDPEES